MPYSKQIPTIGLGNKPALLVVDASYAFTDPQSPLGKDCTNEIAIINGLLHLARAENWPIYFSTVVYRNAHEAAVFREKIPALDMLQDGSKWVEIDERIHLFPQDDLIEKHHASFFHNTDLHDRLQARAIDTLLISGFTTSGCVRATAVDGLQYNYRTIIVENAVGDTHQDAHAANLYDLQRKYGDVLSFVKLEKMVRGKYKKIEKIKN
ncbi:MAG: isochorismatase family protein [Alphaproteobacteria bacterium]|nr:isochorismatase family protein [Alphaproteobacteria bacterium]